MSDVDLERLEKLLMPALLRHARTIYGAGMRKALAEAGCEDIPENGLYVLGALRRDGVTVADLIRQLRVTKQAAGQLIDVLVLRGYVLRASDEADRRRITLALTDRGRAAADIQAQVRDRIDAALEARVGAESVRQARRALAALVAMGIEAGAGSSEAGD